MRVASIYIVALTRRERDPGQPTTPRMREAHDMISSPSSLLDASNLVFGGGIRRRHVETRQGQVKK